MWQCHVTKPLSLELFFQNESNESKTEETDRRRFEMDNDRYSGIQIHQHLHNNQHCIMSTSNNLYAEFGEYKWPSTLYEELSDQAKLSTLVYSFADVFGAARKAHADGVDFYGIDPTDIHYSITPGELKVVLEKNVEYLEQKAEFDAEDVAEKGAYLQAYQDEADASNIKNAIALEYFNDTFADREALYAITRDSIKKRITVVYRGSVTRNNWLYNLRFLQTEVDMPTMLQKEGGENEEKLYFHTGFYSKYKQRSTTFVCFLSKSHRFHFRFERVRFRFHQGPIGRER